MVGSDYGELPELLREIRGRGLDSCFEIVAGTAEPERYYRAMDVYVCASEVEGMSNSILEAMASGIPVIATNVGGNPELVVNGQTGFLVPPFAPDMIAANALTLISERILRSGMGRRALQIVQERYTADAMVKAHEDLYSDLVGKALVG